MRSVARSQNKYGKGEIKNELSIKGNATSSALTVHEKENLISQVGTVCSTEVLVKLFIKCNIVLRFDTKDSVAPVDLVDMINVVETVGPEVLQD